MSEEFLDIVDENNNLIGKKAPRREVHAKGLWHRTVHIYIFRKNNNVFEFLVHLRSPFKDSKPNKWDTRFGDHIKSGSTLEEGVKSELEEEIGLSIENRNLIEGDWRKRDIPPNREFSQRYFLEYGGNLTDLKFNDGEVQEVKWMTVREVKDSMEKDRNEWAASLGGFVEISDYLQKNLVLSSKPPQSKITKTSPPE